MINYIHYIQLSFEMENEILKNLFIIYLSSIYLAVIMIV